MEIGEQEISSILSSFEKNDGDDQDYSHLSHQLEAISQIRIDQASKDESIRKLSNEIENLRPFREESYSLKDQVNNLEETLIEKSEEFTQKEEELYERLRELELENAKIREQKEILGSYLINQQKSNQALSVKIEDLEDSLENKRNQIENLSSEVGGLQAQVESMGVLLEERDGDIEDLKEVNINLTLDVKKYTTQANEYGMRVKSLLSTKEVMDEEMEKLQERFTSAAKESTKIPGLEQKVDFLLPFEEECENFREENQSLELQLTEIEAKNESTELELNALQKENERLIDVEEEFLKLEISFHEIEEQNEKLNEELTVKETDLESCKILVESAVFEIERFSSRVIQLSQGGGDETFDDIRWYHHDHPLHQEDMYSNDNQMDHWSVQPFLYPLHHSMQILSTLMSNLVDTIIHSNHDIDSYVQLAEKWQEREKELLTSINDLSHLSTALETEVMLGHEFEKQISDQLKSSQVIKTLSNDHNLVTGDENEDINQLDLHNSPSNDSRTRSIKHALIFASISELVGNFKNLQSSYKQVESQCSDYEGILTSERDDRSEERGKFENIVKEVKGKHCLEVDGMKKWYEEQIEEVMKVNREAEDSLQDSLENTRKELFSIKEVLEEERIENKHHLEEHQLESDMLRDEIASIVTQLSDKEGELSDLMEVMKLLIRTVYPSYVHFKELVVQKRVLLRTSSNLWNMCRGLVGLNATILGRMSGRERISDLYSNSNNKPIPSLRIVAISVLATIRLKNLIKVL